MRMAAHELAQIDVSDPLVVPDDDHVLVVGVGTGFAEVGGASHDNGLTRDSGDTPVEGFARDLIALTKMDWNTFALYNKKLPVTVTTPGTTARIARLLDRLPAESYDYRLFM